MIPRPQAEKHFASASRRFLQASIERFLDAEFPRTFGPVIRQKMAEKIVELVDGQLPAKDYLRPGQCVWNAVSIRTRPDSSRCQLIPVILTLVEGSDIEELAQGTRMTHIAQKAIARITQEAYQQGALLSMRDIGLLVWRTNARITNLRQAWETRQQTTLPHPGNLQDFGTCISHKTTIIRAGRSDGSPGRCQRQEPLAAPWVTNATICSLSPNTFVLGGEG